MKHQPTQLALLISLIGVGVAPCANASSSASARLDDRVVDTTDAIEALQPLPGITCSDLEIAMVPGCGARSDLVWQPPRDPLDRTATAGVRVLYANSRDDWAPGEVGGEPAQLGQWVPHALAEPVASKPAEARDPDRLSAGKSADKSLAKAAGKRAEKSSAHRVRMLARAPTPARMQNQWDDSPIEHLAQIDAIALPKSIPPLAEASSKQSDILLESLAAVLYAEPATAAPAATVTELVEAPAPIRLREAEPAHIERPQASVESQSNKVLRQLGAILSDERDEVGAIRTTESQAVVTTQSSKVIAMLGEIAATRPAVEDGPARRLRKLAAQAAKAEAKAAAEAAPAAATALAAEIERDGGDLVLPLEMPAVVATMPADGDTASKLIQPAALPVGAQFAAVAAPAKPAAPTAHRGSPFGDTQVAIAEKSLDRVRGGFAFEGLNISFGIERAIYVNGALVTTTSMNVSDLGQISAGRGLVALDSGTIALIQSGAGNAVASGSISAAAVGTVVQNTLDGQHIQNVTTINATANSLSLFRTLNLGSSLRGAVIDSLRR